MTSTGMMKQEDNTTSKLVIPKYKMPISKQNIIDGLSAMVRIPSVNTFGHHDAAHPAESAMADYFENS